MVLFFTAFYLFVETANRLPVVAAFGAVALSILVIVYALMMVLGKRITKAEPQAKLVIL